MKYFAFSFLLMAACFLTSCVVDYDMKGSNERIADRLTVNGFLTSEENISVLFGAVNRTDSGYTYTAVKGVNVKITEDGNILYSGTCEDTVLLLDRRPKAKSRYRIEAALDGYESVSAETAVPETVSCKLKYKWKPSGYYYPHLICGLYDFSNYEKDAQSAVYISYYNREKGDTLMEITSLYSKNLLADNINRVGGMPVLNMEVGSLYFENFMRVRKANIPKVDTLVFAPEYGRNEGYVRVLTASDEYDRYTRTSYEQSVNVGYGDLDGAFVRLVTVYSNISNGYGIFAGYSTDYFYVEREDADE